MATVRGILLKGELAGVVSQGTVVWGFVFKVMCHSM